MAFTERADMPKKYADTGERIIANSILSKDNQYNGTPCWEWIGKTNGHQGYPVFTKRWQSGPRKGKVHNVFAHRESLRFFRGVLVRKQYVVMHLCNNRLCVNPMHLRQGRQDTNMQHCVESGRHYSPFAMAAIAADFEEIE